MEGGGQKGSRTCFVGCFEFLEVPAPAPVVSLWVEFSRPSRGTRVRRSTRHQRTFRLGLPDLPATQLQPSSENVRWVLGELWASIVSRRDGGSPAVACRLPPGGLRNFGSSEALAAPGVQSHVDSRGFPSGPVMHVAQFHPSAAAARAAVTLLFLVPAWGPVLYEVQVNAATLIFTSIASSSNTPVGLIGSFFHSVISIPGPAGREPFAVRLQQQSSSMSCCAADLPRLRGSRLRLAAPAQCLQSTAFGLPSSQIR
jgi:hypothetical protein